MILSSRQASGSALSISLNMDLFIEEAVEEGCPLLCKFSDALNF